MSIEENALRERLKAAIECGLTVKAAAIEIGSEERKVRAWLDNKSVDGMFNLVKAWCAQVDKEMDESLPGIVRTPTFRKIQTALQATREDREIVTIFGAPGTGKTATINEFRKEFSHYDTFGHVKTSICYIEAEEKTSMPRLLQSLTTAFFGQYDMLWGKTEVANRLSDCLNGAAGAYAPVIIVDEVQRLDNNLIAGLAWFYNQRRISLVLCGNEGKHTEMYSGKNKELAALSDRAAYRLHLVGPSSDDLDTILTEWRIKGRAERAFMQKARERLNSLRPLLRILRLAAGFARMSKTDVDIRVLRTVAQDMGFQFLV